MLGPIGVDREKLLRQQKQTLNYFLSNVIPPSGTSYVVYGKRLDESFAATDKELPSANEFRKYLCDIVFSREEYKQSFVGSARKLAPPPEERIIESVRQVLGWPGPQVISREGYDKIKRDINEQVKKDFLNEAWGLYRQAESTQNTILGREQKTEYQEMREGHEEDIKKCASDGQEFTKDEWHQVFTSRKTGWERREEIESNFETMLWIKDVRHLAAEYTGPDPEGRKKLYAVAGAMQELFRCSVESCNSQQAHNALDALKEKLDAVQDMQIAKLRWPSVHKFLNEHLPQIANFLLNTNARILSWMRKTEKVTDKLRAAEEIGQRAVTKIAERIKKDEKKSVTPRV